MQDRCHSWGLGAHSEFQRAFQHLDKSVDVLCRFTLFALAAVVMWLTDNAVKVLVTISSYMAIGLPQQGTRSVRAIFRKDCEL